VGRRVTVDAVRRHPLMRAVRADKLTYAALEATLALWAQPPGRAGIPVYAMVTASLEALDRRAGSLRDRLSAIAGLRATVVDGVSTIGGGSAPGSALPTRLVAVEIAGVTAASLEARLRGADPPVIARIQDNRVVLDVRTVMEGEEEAIATALGSSQKPEARSQK
jgi:L-seryl-tRNA(Ser) seleniumtransferase